MRKIANHEVEGKTVLVRVDLNCPLENGKITSHIRINAHAVTLKNLSDRGAKVVVLSHQGRKGSDDFVTLEQHSKILQDILGREVLFVNDMIGPVAIEAISKLTNGQIIVLDNVRHLHCETGHPRAKGEIVYHLSPLADYFVLDALSVAHRAHSSIIGFKDKVPCFAGDVLAEELDAVDKIRQSDDVTFIFGGSKVKDSFKVMDKWLTDGRAKKILVGGALSVLLLRANGCNIGGSSEYLKESGLDKYLPAAIEMLEKYDGKIHLPTDVGLSFKKEEHGRQVVWERVESDVSKIETGQIWDIGEKSTNEYSDIISSSKCIVMNGPLGVYELDKFSKGTKTILDSIAKTTVFSLLGGGHTLAALEKFNIDKNQFGYVSLSGKALIAYLCGDDLPGLVSLEENEKLFDM
jgi:phosphoglycerate kinase